MTVTDLQLAFGAFILALLIAFLTYIGPSDYANEVAIEADLKEARVEAARESFALTHPLSCAGTWIKKCADFKPCEEICVEDKQ